MRKTVEKLKTLIIVFLVLSMLFLWVKNMQLYFPRNTAENSSLLASDFWIFNDSTEEHSEVIADSSYFSPVSVTLITNRVAYTSATNKNLTKVLWDNYKSLVKEVFSNSYTCQKATLNDWENALKNDDFILINFPFSIPYMTLCAFENKTVGFAGGELCSIKTLLLHSDENNTVSAMSTDADGNVFSFTPSDLASSLIYDFNSNNLTAYTVNKGFISSTLAINEKSDAASGLPPHHAILTQAPNLKSLKISNPISDLFVSEYSDNITNLALISNPTVISLLENFNINPSTVGVYTDAAARLIFINADTRLVVDRKGAIEYAVSRESNAQVLTSELLESERSQFSSFEQITAVTHFLNLFKGTFIGNDADLLLNGIQHSNGKTEYTFKYYKNLCEISCENVDAEIKLVFDSTGLLEARIVPLIITDEQNSGSYDNYVSTGISEMTALVLSSLEKDNLHDFSPVYICTAYDRAVVPVWASVVERE